MVSQWITQSFMQKKAKGETVCCRVHNLGFKCKVTFIVKKRTVQDHNSFVTSPFGSGEIENKIQGAIDDEPLSPRNQRVGSRVEISTWTFPCGWRIGEYL